MMKPWKEKPMKSCGKMAMLVIRNWSKNKVITLINQEKRPRVTRFMGRSKSLMIGLTILFSRSQTMLAVKIT